MLGAVKDQPLINLAANVFPHSKCSPHPIVANIDPTGILDTGTSSNYGGVYTPFTPHPSPAKPIVVSSPNGTTNVSHASGTLPTSNLPPAAREVHVFNTFSKGTLISGSKLCDKGCTLQFTACNVVVFDQNGTKIILVGGIPLQGYGKFP